MKRGTILAAAAVAAVMAGCAASSAPAPEKKTARAAALPAWVGAPEAEGVIRAVGSAPRNFQGVYMQRNAAMTDARDRLAHKIRVVISAAYASKFEERGEHLSRETQRKITEISRLLLRQSRQVDGYIDGGGRLYVLAEVPDVVGGRPAGVSKEGLPDITPEPFDPSALKQSRCYPREVTEKIHTKYGLYLGKPVWFFRPDYRGHTGAVGIAEKESGRGFDAQKRAALALARSDLAKRKRLRMDSRHALVRIFKHDLLGSTFEKELKTTSVSKVTETVQEDIWLDPKSCELYVWIVEKE